MSSKRFNLELIKTISRLNLSKSIILNGNINNTQENIQRLEIMSLYRGYPDSDMFNNFPIINEWKYVDHAKAIINTLNEYIEKNYNLILTSHYIPEGIEAVKTKIAYIETIINIASDSKEANDMIEKVKAEYPNYSGLNYLVMTAEFFFPEN